jgi:hypothetical protein
MTLSQLGQNNFAIIPKSNWIIFNFSLLVPIYKQLSLWFIQQLCQQADIYVRFKVFTMVTKTNGSSEMLRQWIV